MSMPFGTKMQLVKRKQRMEGVKITVRCSWPGCTSSVSAYRSQSVWGVGRKSRGVHTKNAYCPSCKDRVERVIGWPLRMNGFGRVFSILAQNRQSRICNSVCLRAYLFIKQNGACEFCKSDISFRNYPSSWQVDHFVPLAVGGGSSIGNLQILCTDCHKKKTSSELVSARKHNGIPNSRRQWTAHHQKDELIIKQNAEIARLKSLLAGYVNGEELAG